MVSDLESLQAEADSASEPDAADAPAADDVATEEEEAVTTPDPEEEGDNLPDPEEEGESPDPPEPEGGEDVDPQGLLKYYDQRHGRSYTGQFKDDNAFVDSWEEKDKLLGQRNEDAQLLKQLRDRIGEDRLKGLLAEEAAPSSASKPARDANLPRSLEEYSLLQEAAARPDATPATKEKATAAQKAFYKRLWNDDDRDARDAANKAEFAKMVDEKVAKGMDKYRQTVEEERTQERTTAAEAQWVEQNRTKIYIDGKRGEALTPLGKQMAEILDKHPRVKKLPTGVDQWDQALELAELRQPTPNQPRKPSRQAQRRAPVKTGTPKQKTQEERLEEAPSGAAFFQSEFERSQQVAET